MMFQTDFNSFMRLVRKWNTTVNSFNKVLMEEVKDNYIFYFNPPGLGYILAAVLPVTDMSGAVRMELSDKVVRVRKVDEDSARLKPLLDKLDKAVQPAPMIETANYSKYQNGA